ncbi:MAG TPA: hypothetical protein V6D18_04180 [Thermosynechococcaceae cyanobacterium]
MMRLKYAVLLGATIGLTACLKDPSSIPSVSPSISPSIVAKPAASPSPSPKPANPPLTVQKLKNAQYYILASEPTLLKDGQYEKQQQKFKLDDVVAYGDFTKDNIKDAVGSVTIDRDGRKFTYLVAVANDRGNPKNIASEFLGEGVKVQELSASPEKITVKMDKECCPKQEITRSYSLKDIKPAPSAPKEKQAGGTASPSTQKP